MKKSLTTAGAFGLAAATLLTGLSFGPAAAQAAPTAADAASSTFGVWGGNAEIFQPLLPAGTQAGSFQQVRFPDAPYTADAMRDAARLTLPRIGATGPIVTADGRCLTSGLHSNQLRFVTCDTNDVSQNFSPTERPNGSIALEDAQGTWVSSVNNGSIRWWHHGNKTSAYTAFSTIEAQVSDIDISTRSARVHGIASPGAYVVLGDQQSRADDAGQWSIPVTGLALGSTALRAEVYIDQQRYGYSDVTVALDVVPVTATASFPADLGQDAVLSGTAHPGSTIVIRDADGAEIARTPAHLGSGAWTTPISAPNAGGDRPVTIHQEIDGEPNGEITETVAYGAAVQVTMPVDEMAHDGGPVAMRGTGEAGATVTVREQGRTTVLGTAPVLANGQWTINTTNVDDRKHVLEATQTGKGNNVTSSTVTLNPEAGNIDAPTVETPENGSTVTTSRPTFTGHGHDGATVTIGYGANSIIGSAVVENGEWTIAPTRGLGMGVSDLIVTQTIGDDVQTIRHSLTRVAVEVPLAVTSHADGQTYAQGATTFRGTAPVGSAIRATNQWGTVMGTATTTDGTWSFNRNLGPTTAGYALTFTATPPVGAPQTVSLRLNYAGVLGFQVTSPVNNSTYTVGTTTFTGTAVPNAVVTATNQWGTPMGRATADLDTSWDFDRYLGPTSAGYDITFVATKGTDTQRTALHLDPEVANAPVAVTSIADGATYRPGLNVLAGTGTPGATVEAVNATNGWNVPMGRATVDNNGTWALPERNWGPSNDYAIKVTQTNPDKTTSTTTVDVKAPVFAPLALTSPQVGDTYDTGVAALFQGTATPFAQITVRSAQSSTVYRTFEADAAGNWSFTRVWGPTHDYVLNIEQKARNGHSDAITGFAWNDSGN